ncbi:MAG: hypothetical protein KZQ94_13260 [Candidatus Thiodiazotropha sp. (ex Troendleina suluensis)]|nr:hypothetical protein [Candidatus Thiodiazotropha sp. (ex Troendleina suluensis)]
MTGRFKRDPCISHIADWIAYRGQQLYPDRVQAEIFLERLDSQADFFSFRTFSDTQYTLALSHDPLERAIYGSLTACWNELVQLNRQGAVICVTINHTIGEGRESSDIDQVRALFIDDDRGGDPGRFPLQPHIRVESSPSHYHYYWLVQGLPLQRFTTYQQQLASCYQGDTRIQALNQAMQIPGFWRRKRVVEPRFPKILRISRHPPFQDSELRELLIFG